jgi:hypothetical protein
MAISKWQRVALYIVGAWTAFGGISALLDPRAHGETFFGDASIADSGGAQILFSIAYAQLIAWGAGYVLAARKPAMSVPMLAAGALGKLGYFALTVLAYERGSGTAALLATGIGDLAIASFFAFLIVRSIARPASQPARS